MSTSQTPRSIVKAMVRGEAPARPLLMPLMFALGARLENLSLRDFRLNPTRITNALKQMRGVLKLDGLTCYFDSLLEMKALGCNCVEDEQGARIERALPRDVDALRERLQSPSFPTTSGPINVTCEVLRRLKWMLLDEPALMVVINGPLALAARLSEVETPTVAPASGILADFAAEVSWNISRVFAEAGADVVVIRERWPSMMSHDEVRRWIESVEPIANLLRFYEALPVLLLEGVSGESVALLANEFPDCILIPLASDVSGLLPSLGRRLPGIALPESIFVADQSMPGGPAEASTSLTPEPALAFVTSSQDVRSTADPKQVALVLQHIRSHLSRSAR